jgi:hypothetical protein
MKNDSRPTASLRTRKRGDMTMVTEKKTLCQADLCHHVTRALGYASLKDYEEHVEEPLTEVLAIAAYLKNHKINQDNVADVINIMWPKSEFNARPVAEDPDQDGFYVFTIDVTFPDGSMGMMFAMANGLFDDFETVGWSDGRRDAITKAFATFNEKNKA